MACRPVTTDSTRPSPKPDKNYRPHCTLQVPRPATRSSRFASAGNGALKALETCHYSRGHHDNSELDDGVLITFALGAGVVLHSYENARNVAVSRQLSDQLERTKTELAAATVRLADANNKLAFLETSKARVQVTAYALTDDFGPDPVFSNNAPARSAYAVPKHSLPTGEILNVALSPTAEQRLHANLNDTIVLMSRNHSCKHLARYVDRTAQTETRPVVDVLFADAHQARIWGRQSFYAVNISRLDSPFQQR